LLRKGEELGKVPDDFKVDTILPKEKDLIIKLYKFNATLQNAAKDYSPAVIANYVYDLAKEYSQYYHDTHIFKESDDEVIKFRLSLSKRVGEAIKASLDLLGIDVPDRM
jgi:arginyl-tRNA synthetase